MEDFHVSSKEMCKLLEQNGFKKVRSNGSHYIYRNSETNRTTTVPFHGSKNLKKGTEHNIRKQAGLK